MSRGPVVNVTITGDASGLDRAFKKAADGVNGFGGSLKRVFNEKIIGGAIDLAARGAQEAFNFATDGIGKFDALGDSISLIDADFKGLSGSIDKLDLSKLGFSDIATAEAASAIADTAKALGLSGKEAKAIVPDLTEAAAAYSAMTGKDAATAGDLMAKALGGSSKAAKELGIEFRKGMTPAERAQAVMAKFGPLAKEAADGTRSLADEQGTFNAQMENIQIAVGGFLNNALTPLMAGINGTLFPALQAFGEKYGPQIAQVTSVIGEVFGAVFGFIGNEVVPIVMEVAGAIGKALGPVFAEVGKTIKAWEPIFSAVFGWIKQNVVPLLTGTLIPILGKLLEALAKVSQFVAGALIEAWKRISPVISKVGDILRSVLGLIGDVIRKIASAPIIKDFINFISGDSGGSSSTSGNTRTGSGRPGLVPTSIVVNTGVGDPVAIGREVSRVLGAYSVRAGHA
jgi:hypothetical protein